MAKRHKRRAKLVRWQLMNLLGRRCTFCRTKQDLEFDCIQPMGDAHHRLDTDRRMKFYCQQFLASNLQLLCSSCNARKGDQIVASAHMPLWPYNYGSLKQFVPAATYKL